MSDTVIRVENLSKRYFITHQTRNRRAQGGQLTEKIQQWVSHPVRRMLGRKDDALDGGRTEREEFWALKDVSFEVKRGDVLGVIGRNGAGKSTLLKILSRITEPTRGEIKIKGRIASLLEVGTGFHPELTGRENIFLNGSILGMSRTEIQSKFDEIVAFAEVEKFLDTQVKHYSSGMYVRLAFAVAAHLEPEILIVDEVLAVGDVQFQSKCLSKIDRISKNGRTILFVSHNTTAVRSLCNKVLWLHRGERHSMGEPHTILSDYLGQGNQQKQEHVWEAPPSLADLPAYLTRVSVSSDSDRDPHLLTTDDGILISVAYENLHGNTVTNVSVVLSTPEEVPIFNTWSDPAAQPQGTVQCTCRIPRRLLNAGTYHVRVLLVRDGSRAIQDENATLTFTVLEGPRKGSWMGTIIGVVHPELDWSTKVQPPLTQCA